MDIYEFDELGASNLEISYRMDRQEDEEDGGVVQVGKQIMKDLEERQEFVSYPTEEMIAANGGEERFYAIFTRFYERLFEDPLMVVLFRETKEDRAPEEHGRLLGAFLMQHFTRGDRTYWRLLKQEKIGHGLGIAHYRAQSCPMRPEHHVGRGFTENQQLAWIGHMSTACKDTSTNEELQTCLVRFLAGQLFRYGPYIQD